MQIKLIYFQIYSRSVKLFLVQIILYIFFLDLFQLLIKIKTFIVVNNFISNFKCLEIKQKKILN